MRNCRRNVTWLWLSLLLLLGYLVFVGDHFKVDLKQQEIRHYRYTIATILNYTRRGIYTLSFYVFNTITYVPYRQHDDVIIGKLDELTHSKYQVEYQQVKRYMEETDNFPWHYYQNDSVFYPSWKFIRNENDNVNKIHGVNVSNYVLKYDKISHAYI